MVTDFYELWDQQKQAQHTHPAAPAGPASPFNGTDHPYALAALRAECDDLADLPPDSRRNQTLNDAAFKMARHVGAGSINASTVRSGLEAAARACQLPQAEIDTVLRDHGALSAGQAHPRVVPAPNGRTSWAPSGSHLKSETDLSQISSTPPADDAQQPAEPQDHTSWWPKDIVAILDGSEPEQPPTHLLREDGKPLLYPGTVNGLIGESESGKSWVALLLVAQRLAAGVLVAYMDFEDVARNVIARLRLLGVTDEQFAQFRYIGPDETLHEKAFMDLQGVLASSPDTIVVDGFNAAMTLLGLSLESNQDATKFFQSFLNMCAASGACVVYVDHVPKNKEQRGKGGIGAQAKRAMTKGAAYIVEIVKPFGRGMAGTISLDVDKDSAGHVRGYSAGARAGIVHLDSTGNNGTVNMRIEVPAGAVQDAEGNVPPWRPTYLMERVSRFLETLPDGASGEAMQRELGGNRDALKKAIGFLVDDGYAVRGTGDRGAVITKIVKAYRQPVEQSDDVFGGAKMPGNFFPSTGFDSPTSTTSTTPQPDPNQARCETTPVDLNQTMPPPTGAWLRSEGSTGGAGKAAKVSHLNRVDDVVVNPHTGEIIITCASCGEPMAAVEPDQKTHPGCVSQ